LDRLARQSQTSSSGLLSQVVRDLDPPFTGSDVFDCLKDIVYFIKNERRQYVEVNSTLVERCGRSNKSELLGKTASEIWPNPLGQRHEDQDARLLDSGRPLLSQLEMHLFSEGRVGWCMTNKFPIVDRTRGTIGLVGISQDLRVPNDALEEFEQVSKALEFAKRNIGDSISVRQLATVAGLSPYQLDRRMRMVFGLTTGQWLLKQRIDLACRLLTESEKTIASVAMESGYSDQSAFARQFRRATGVVPGEYRAASREETKN